MDHASPLEKGWTSVGLPPSQIRALIGIRDEDLNEVGRVIEEEPNRITETINRYKGRRNERIRVKLAAHVNLPYKKLWGEEPVGKSNERDGRGGGVKSNYAAKPSTAPRGMNQTER
jgi:hypothetical protein